MSVPSAARPVSPVPSAARDFWRLPEEELARLLALIRQVDHVEHKFVVPESGYETACAALGVDLARARSHRMYFLDTDDQVSTRSPAEVAPQSAARTAALLHAYGIDLSGPQQTKTLTTLNYFVQRRRTRESGDHWGLRAH